MKILVVDDELPARQRIADLLADICTNPVILEAENGLEAVKLAEQEKPDTVLMDIRMPVMDGLEMGLEIKKCFQNFVKDYLKVQKKQI